MNVLNWFSRAERPAAVTASIRKDGMVVQPQDSATVISPEAEGPSQKKQKLSSDRITVDVGGTKFFTTRSTLISSSAYFESLLSDEWDETKESEVYLDQDPSTFAVILGYMRRRTITIEAINVDVLHLAEFLGLEELLSAVKIRWYCAIGIGPVLHDDEDIAAAFEREHGGVVKALSDGLFDCFLNGDHDLAEKDYASFQPLSSGILTLDINAATSVTVTDLSYESEGREQKISSPGLVGALNGLHANGYSLDSDQINHDAIGSRPLTFSRKKHSIVRSNATGIFIPAAHEGKQTASKYVRQFAAYAKNEELEYRGEPYEKIIAPAGLTSDSSNPYDEVAIVNGTYYWLEKNGFVNREVEIEEQEIFKVYISSLFSPDHDHLNLSAATVGGVYSRLVLRTQRK